MNHLIKEIEEKYEVEKIKVDGFTIWQVIRINYISELIKNAFEDKAGDSLNIKDYAISRYKKIINSTWQMKNFYKQYDYILFTDVLEERKINEKISDKIAYNIVKLVGDDLLISLNPISYEHKSIDSYYHKNYISDNIFGLIEKIKNMKKSKFYIENESILESIEKEYKINIEYNKIISDFFSRVKIFNKYFKKHKPKLIFVNCYYGVSHQAIIYAAHLNNIRVIELQHGIINDKHYSYNIFKPIGRESFPDYIFTFGEYVLKYISSNFIKRENIIPVGNFYLEYCKEEASKDKNLKEYFQELRKKYTKIVAVTSQITIEERLIDFIKKSAEKNSDIIYIFIPRFYDKDFNKYNFPTNVVINDKIDFYHTVPFADFHCTVYSTCALEAPSLGTPNILINIDNLSYMHLKEIAEISDLCRCANSPEELVSIIMNWDNRDRDNIMNIGNLFYESNNKENIRRALTTILDEKF